MKQLDQIEAFTQVSVNDDRAPTSADGSTMRVHTNKVDMMKKWRWNTPIP
jgi:hypothetical protein